MTTTSEWLASIGEVCDELGYGIVDLTRHKVVLIARQRDVTVTIEASNVGSALIFETLHPLPHNSGSGTTPMYDQERVGRR